MTWGVVYAHNEIFNLFVLFGSFCRKSAAAGFLRSGLGLSLAFFLFSKLLLWACELIESFSTVRLHSCLFILYVCSRCAWQTPFVVRPWLLPRLSSVCSVQFGVFGRGSILVDHRTLGDPFGFCFFATPEELLAFGVANVPRPIAS